MEFIEAHVIHFLTGISLKVFHVLVHDLGHSLTTLQLSEITQNHSIKIPSQT